MKPAYLIVNADDFGLTEGTNRAIVHAHRQGIVTSTSLLANGYAFDHAVQSTREVPTLGVGVHLTLTEGLPVSANAQALLDQNGKLPLSNQPFARSLITGRLPADAIRAEFRAQIEKILNTGIRPTHLDGHKYIHLLPGIIHITAELAREFSIPVIRAPRRVADRLPRGRMFRLPGLVLITAMSLLASRVVRRAGLQTVDRLVGFVDTGALRSNAVSSLLSVPQSGFTELLAHPAYRSPEHDALLEQGYNWISGYDFESERAAVSDPDLRDKLIARGWTLVNFQQLSARAPAT
jgi:chitin disaccharide deacetylase